MDKDLTLPAQKREVFGKKNRVLRKKSQIPAILYGHGVKNIPLKVDRSQFIHVFKEAGSSALVTLKIGDEKATKVLIHQTQVHPITGDPIHIDFYQVKMTEKIKTQVPIKIVGESKAVKELEGNLITNKDSIEIECLPSDLLSEIEADITPLKTFEDVLKVKDLHVPKTVTVLDDPEEVVVLVTPPRSEEELEELEKEVEEKVEEVEVTTEKKPEEGEEAPAEGEAAEEKAPSGQAKKPAAPQEVSGKPTPAQPAAPPEGKPASQPPDQQSKK